MAHRSGSTPMACAALAAALVVCAAPAVAAVLKIYPMQFLERNNAQYSFRSPANIGAAIGREGEFWAPLSLPAGAVITGLSFWHSGVGSGAPLTRVSIASKLSTEKPKYDPSGVADAEGSGATGTPVTVQVVGSLTSGPHQVLASRRYWVNAYCVDGGMIWEVDVTYTAP